MPVAQLLRRFHDICVRAFVDDIRIEIPDAKRYDLARRTARVAVEFDELLRSAGCETSPNMRVMDTQAAVARTAAGLLRMRGVVGSMAECAADLGSTYTMRRGRRIEAHIGRMKSASKRATGLRRLAGAQWAVRKLAKIGPGAKLAASKSPLLSIHGVAGDVGPYSGTLSTKYLCDQQI